MGRVPRYLSDAIDDAVRQTMAFHSADDGDYVAMMDAIVRLKLAHHRANGLPVSDAIQQAQQDRALMDRMDWTPLCFAVEGPFRVRRPV